MGAERGLVPGPDGHVDVRLDQAESPLAWLARRKGRDGQALIAPEQLQAGDRAGKRCARRRPTDGTSCQRRSQRA